MPRGAVAALLLPALALPALAGCGGQPDPEPVQLRLAAELTQDSRDAAATRVAVVVVNQSAEPVTPSALEYADPRLSAPLIGGRLREIPAGGARRFPLPLVDPVCGAPADPSARLTVRAGSAQQQVAVGDDIGVIERWVQRRCAELDVAAVAPLELTEVRVQPGGDTADLVLTATPSGEGSGAYLIETVGGTPVFTSAGEPWRPEVVVSASGEPVEVLLRARPARCDGHVFGESAGATAFLVGLRLDGQQREVLVRMAAEVAADALDFAVAACRR